jgi:hypothetical protein
MKHHCIKMLRQFLLLCLEAHLVVFIFLSFALLCFLLLCELVLHGEGVFCEIGMNETLPSDNLEQE